MLAFYFSFWENIILRFSHAKMQIAAFSRTLCLCLTQPAPVLRRLYGCSQFDIFSYWKHPPAACFFPFSSFLPFLPSLSAVFCPPSLYAWPALLWLLTSKSYYIHQSLIREEGGTIHCCAKRGGDGEWVYKKKRGNDSLKREKEDPLLTAGDPRSHKSKEGPRSHSFHKVETLSHTLFGCFLSRLAGADASYRPFISFFVCFFFP